MTIRDFISKFSKDKVETKRKFKDIEEDFELHRRLEEKQKSANERELEKFVEEEREAKIKNELSKYRKKAKTDLWTSNSIFGAKTTMLENNSHMMDSDMFGKIGGSKKQLKRKGMYFR